MDIDIDYKELLIYDREESRSVTLPYDIVIDNAKDSVITTNDGKKLIDFTSANDNNLIGYGQGIVNNYIKDNIENSYFASPLVKSEQGESLSNNLLSLTGLSKVFYNNSALEANICALNIALTKARYDKDIPEKSEMITLIDNKLVSHLRLWKYNNSMAETPCCINYDFEFISQHAPEVSILRNIVSWKTAAIIMEPFKIVNNVYLIDHNLLKLAREVADRYQATLILDLTKISPGRTGTYLPEFPVQPDILTLSNGLAQGLPLAATLINDNITRIIRNNYQHYYGASTLALGLAVKVLEHLEQPKILELIDTKAKYLYENLDKLREKYICIVDIQQKGLLFDIEFDFNIVDLINGALEDGIVLEALDKKVLRLRPPLTITNAEMDKLKEVLDDLLNRLRNDSRME